MLRKLDHTPEETPGMVVGLMMVQAMWVVIRWPIPYIEPLGIAPNDGQGPPGEWCVLQR